MIDPALKSDQLAGRIVDFVIRTFNAVQGRMGSSQKKQLEMVKNVPTKLDGVLRFPAHSEADKPMAKYTIKTVADLIGGENPGCIFTCRILMHIDRPQSVPQSCLVIDSKNVAAVVSFYGTNDSLKEKIHVGDLVYIKDPQLILT